MVVDETESRRRRAASSGRRGGAAAGIVAAAAAGLADSIILARDKAGNKIPPTGKAVRRQCVRRYILARDAGRLTMHDAIRSGVWRG